MWRFLPLLFLFAISGCGTSGPSAPVEDGVEMVSLDREHHRATIGSGWINLRTLELNGEEAEPEEDEVFVRGLVTGWVFAVDGSVEGPIKTVPEEAEVEDVWLRLRDRSIQPREPGSEPPVGGAIAGVFDRETELFYPRDRVIHQREIVVPSLPESPDVITSPPATSAQ